MISKKPSVVSWGIFVATLGIVLITLTSAVFPALLIRTMGGIPNYFHVNPFEIGIWAWPLIVTDSIVFALTILYFRNRLPQVITKSIRFIFDFEVSARIAFVVITILLGIFIILTVSQLFTPEPWEDYKNYKKYIENFNISDLGKGGFDRVVRDVVVYSSFHFFGNEKVVPFIESIALLVLTYFITTNIAKKRFAGIVAMVIVLQSSIFQTYVASPTYEYSWILLYILSLYIIYKRLWPLSPISYILSMLSKPLTAAFFPVTLFFIYSSSITRQRKVRLAISYGIVAFLMITAFVFLNFDKSTGGFRGFSSHDFLEGFAAFPVQFRFDGLIVLFLLPLIIGLGIASRSGIIHADSILVLIMWTLLLSSLLIALTYETNQPYRFVSLIVFFAIGVGTLLSKNISRLQV